MPANWNVQYQCAQETAEDIMFKEQVAAEAKMSEVLNDIIRTKYFPDGITGAELQTKADKIAARFSSLLNDGCNGEITNYFDYMACGAFKECYELGLPGWVIKFCCTRNCTELEQQILEDAARDNVDHFFIPTYFIPIPAILVAQNLEPCTGNDRYDSYQHDWVPRYPDSDNYDMFNYVQIQPMVQIQEHVPFNNFCRGVKEDGKWVTKYARLIDLVGDPIDSSTMSCGDINSADWIQTAINAYGITSYKNLQNFVKKYQISDLHNENIGYLLQDGERFPVIVDWLSH